MFRKMRRFKQEISREECIKILVNEPRGVLSMIGDDGYPYGIPINHLYDEKDGKIYFHGAKEGHKIDALKACDKVSYCVYDKGYRREGEWSLNIRSVVVFGKISFVTDAEKTKEICMSFCAKFSDDKAYAVDEFEKAGKFVLCLELTPEHISGKMVNES